MHTYSYKARDEAGKAVTGALRAPSKEEVVKKLRTMGYLVSRVDETISSGLALNRLSFGVGRVKARDIAVFCVQLANMLSAGLPLLMCLNTLKEQVESESLKSVVGEVGRSVEGGSSFSDAIALHPRVFAKLFIHTARAGESSGKLDLVLERLAAYLEYQEDLKEQIKGALFYPLILMIAGVAVIMIVVTFVVPQFVDIFSKAGVTLPLATRILHGMGIAIKQYWYLVLGFAFSTPFIGRWFLRTEFGGSFCDRWVLKIPVVGALVRKVAISRFARTLSTLVASGVPMLMSLDLVKEVVGNRVIASSVDKARQAVEGGSKLAEPLKIEGEFPLDAIQMISVGEETGDLDGMLDRIANFYDRSVGYTVKKLSALIEPIFLVVMGVMVGLIMAALLMPIFDLAKTLRR